MLTIISFFGALIAGAAADTVLNMRTDSNQDDDDNTDPQDPDQDPQTPDRDLLAFLDNPDGADMLPSDAPAIFDNLPDRIHSSDAYPQPPLPEPIVASAGDSTVTPNGAGLDDWLTGGSANTVLAGHGGNDVLRAGTGPTHQIGGEGNDTLWGGAGDDQLEGCEGDDVLIASGGSNTLLGGAGNDVLIGFNPGDAAQGGDGPNFLNGGDGNDLLIAGSGDYLNGGAGEDTFLLGEWLQENTVVSIMDYHADEDQILLQYDPLRLDDPMVEIHFDDATPDIAQIWLNGEMLAIVANAPGLTVGDIGLVPLTGPGLSGLAA